MKKTTSFIVTTLITLLAIGATVYSTSCNRDKCSQVTCFNGGTCQNSFCTCPYGYEGDHCEIRVKTTIEYWNHSQTDIILTLNNVQYTVPAGLSKGFDGGFGDTLQGNAYTHGFRGCLIKWDTIMNTFPVKGIAKVDLNVSAKYFYLYVVNDSASATLGTVIVNQGLTAHSNDSLLIPISLDTAHVIKYQHSMGMGYFKAVDSSNVYVKTTFATGGEWSFRRSNGTLTLYNVENQVATVIAH